MYGCECRALMIRCILTGPQPCELVDVKVDLMYNFNSVTGSGACFRGAQSLKLVKTYTAFPPAPCFEVQYKLVKYLCMNNCVLVDSNCKNQRIPLKLILTLYS